jgi:hypothetical protein
MDNVHLPIHTPLRELDSAGKIHDFCVWFVKLNIKEFEDRIRKPRHIRCGPVHEFVKIPEDMLMHESRQIGMLNVLRGWLPNDLTAEFKLFGHGASPLLLAFSILPLVEKLCVC